MAKKKYGFNLRPSEQQNVADVMSQASLSNLALKGRAAKGKISDYYSKLRGDRSAGEVSAIKRKTSLTDMAERNRLGREDLKYEKKQNKEDLIFGGVGAGLSLLNMGLKYQDSKKLLADKALEKDQREEMLKYYRDRSLNVGGRGALGAQALPLFQSAKYGTDTQIPFAPGSPSLLTQAYAPLSTNKPTITNIPLTSSNLHTPRPMYGPSGKN